MNHLQPNYLKSFTLRNTYKLPIDLQVSYDDNTTRQYLCPYILCKIELIKKNEGWNSVIPIRKIIVASRPLDFIQLVNAESIKGVKHEHLVLKAKPDVTSSDIEKALEQQFQSGDLTFQDFLADYGENIPASEIGELDSYINVNPFLRLVFDREEVAQN